MVKKACEGIIIIGISALVLFTLVDYLMDINLVIGSALTGFAIGITFVKRFKLGG